MPREGPAAPPLFLPEERRRAAVRRRLLQLVAESAGRRLRRPELVAEMAPLFPHGAAAEVVAADVAATLAWLRERGLVESAADVWSLTAKGAAVLARLQGEA